MANAEPNRAPRYDVCCVESAGMPSNHVAIFVETNEFGPGTGHYFQVSGNIQQGMNHNHRPGKRPKEDEQSAFVSKRLLGRVRKEVYDAGDLRLVCDMVEAPPKQFEGPERLFPGQKLTRCNEWTESAVTKLRSEGILAQVEQQGKE